MMMLVMTLFSLIPMMFMVNYSFIQFIYLLIYVYTLVKLNCQLFFVSKISYFFGIDFFSHGLIMLSFLIGCLMIMSMVLMENLIFFIFLNFVLTLMLMVIFSSLNILLMYISFEFVLIPLLVLIMGWGYQPERLMAGMYLFMYTLLVSLPLLMLILYIYHILGCLFFDYINLTSNFFLIHLILVIVFMVKLPMYLVHFWLPKAHVQAPVSGSMILAGLMLKIGGYGLIKVMYMYEYMFMNYSYIWFSVSLVGSLFISMICLIQGDIKSMIAYSSISHMGLTIMGLVTMSNWGLNGAYLLMLGHGFCSSAMFYMANLFYIRTGSRMFFINKGMIMFMPSCALFWFLFCSFNMSCPPSLNFISELMILMSMMMFWFKSVLLFIFISFFCACFSYYLYSYSQHGLFHNLYSFSCINCQEFLCLSVHLVPLVFIPLFLMSLI
nr:NADH dehydrogenase subunit 4 [Hecalus sp.]